MSELKLPESEFIKIVAKKANYSQSIVRDLYEVMRDVFIDYVSSGFTVNIMNVGKFYTKKMSGFTTEHPATREPIYIPDRYKIRFAPSDNLEHEIDYKLN